MKNDILINIDDIDDIVNVKNSFDNVENANMDSATPAGQMMKFASMLSKRYALENLVCKEHAMLHEQGWIHIHDLDYYPTKSTTCLQYDLLELFSGGFWTKKGFIREPQSIKSYVDLTLLVFQANQNEQHGGQSVPAFDFMMAPGVVKSFKKMLKELCCYAQIQNLESLEEIIAILTKNNINVTNYLDLLEKETFQSMESFIYNLNTIHSRGGNQVVFSSINYGTDTSLAGRCVIRNILKATQKGLGKSETPIFPIQIFKIKEGVNYLKTDVNYDLFYQSLQTNALRLFPNYLFLDSEFNKHEKWHAKDPLRWKYEVATMGCRTRVFENINGEKTSLGRGNLSFTSINLVKIALESSDLTSYYNKVEEISVNVANQLIARYNWQKSAFGKQFPFMSQNNLWKGLNKKDVEEQVNDVLNSGTLGIGFIGGHEAMIVLNNCSHAQSSKSQQILLKTVKIIAKVCEQYKNKYQLNFSCLATPAEGLSGRFVNLDIKEYGIIPGVTDKKYYTNSFHVWVKEPISFLKKIQIEAPYHKLCSGGHITYVEFDGEAKQNIDALAQVVKYMKENQIGYGSINHPVDQCRNCYSSGFFDKTCYVCNSSDIIKIRRITGYLVGGINNWNSAKIAEEQDRVKHNK